MLRALMGGGRSSSDLRSSTGSSSGKKKSSSSSVSSSSSRRKKTDSSSKSSKTSSSRGDDRDRGLGDLSTYPSSSSGRRRYASSAAGDSVASGSRSARRRDREPEPESDPEPEPEPIPRALDDDDENDRKSDRRRAQPGDPGYLPPLATGALPPATTTNQFSADIASPGFSQFPMQHDNNPNYDNAPGPLPPSMMPSPHDPNSPATYDPHVPQQFPGQFPAFSAEPYRPSNPAGEAADYYGDQGQSIQDQPGVRPNPPAIIPNPDPHLMPASPNANPPEEPSSMGEVGAAADYYGDGGATEVNGQTSQEPAPKPPKPSKPSKPSGPTGVPDTLNGIPSGLATHGSSESSSVPPMTPMTPGTADPQSATFPHDSFPHSHTIGPGVGAAAGAAAAAGYMAHHHHQSSSSPEHPLQSPYNMQNHEPYTPNGLDQPNPSIYPPHPNPALNGGYAAHPMYPHPAPFQSGGLAFQQRQRNPLDKFIDFWRDPEGAGEFEEYTEAIGICKYCFEPGTSSRDAPRKHNYRQRRRSSDRYSNGSKVDKSARYSSSSDDESRRRSGSSKKSWLGGILSGYAVKSILDNKDFEDSYNVRPSRVSSPRAQSSDSESDSDGKSRTSRGTYRRSPRSRSPRTERGSYSDSKRNKYEGRRRSRSRSRSLDGHAVRDAAIGAAVGSALSEAKSTRSPKSKGRISSNDSSSSSYFDISQPERKSVGGGLGSFFTSSSENRKKRKPRRSKSLFSLQNSSSSSLDADLAFGSGFAKKPSKSQKKKGKGRGKDQDDNVDAKLLGLSAAATALAASPHGHGRRSGEVLAGKDSRGRRADYASSATNDEDWEDLGSDDESSSVSSALAFGGSGLFGNSEDSSDSGTSKWNWRWGSKKDKKKNKKDNDHFPTGPVLAAGAGAAALGTAALASGYRRDGKHSGSSSGGSPESLQRVVPIPTSDPSRFDAVAAQPTFVRPGPIPLQQPQPVMPVSQAVYTSQGDSIPAYSAPAGPPFFGAPVPRHGGGWDSRDEVYPERTHRRRDSSPVYHPEPFQGSTISSFKRRSMPRDTSSVQFDLTQEQADKERRADRRERKKRESSGDQGIHLFDREYEDEESSRRERRRRERRSSDYDGSLFSRSSASRKESPDRERRRLDDDREKDSSSWIGPAAAVGTVGAAAAAATVMSRRSSEDASERREKRRAERRRTSSEQGSETSVHSRVEPSAVHVEDATPIDNQPSPATGKYSPSWMDRKRPEYDDYAAFFAPEGLQYSPDPNSHAQRPERFAMPTIDEGEPVTAPYAPALPQRPEAPYPNYGGLPWPVPQLNLIEPTPPHSQNGSVRDIASPIPPPPELSYREAPSPGRPTTGSRVSWGKNQTHEFEDHPPSEHDSVDHDAAREGSRDVEDAPIGKDIELDAVVAATMASTGFNPKMVTDNSKYHTGSPPPESGFERQGARWEGPALQRFEPHGFVEGEVDTPGADGQDSFAPDYVSRDQKDASDIEHERSLPREALEQPPKDQLFREIPWKEEPTNRDEDMFSMPGSFDPVEPTEKSTNDPKPRSVVSEGGAKDKKRRNKKRSSKGSTEFDDSASVNSSPAWISDERQGKSGREERRRERDSAGGHEKDLKKDILPYAGALALPFAMAALDSRPRSRSASPPASAKTVDPGTGSQSRPSSPEMISNNERRNTSRRSSTFHESPTAVPLHFRYPPGASPGGTQRSPSGGSPGVGVTAQSPGSPTQKRPRTSSEFKHSREIRPLWLVERHGNAKNEPQQEDEPLPPLPASTVSSRNPSVEDLQGDASDEKSWEVVDLSREINDNPALAISTPSHEQADLERGSDSQQVTPTKAAFGQEYARPPTSTEKKEKPKYEFHTPSELLRDPSTYAELPPPTTETPSSEQVNDDRDREIFPQGIENIPLPDSRPSTPQDKQIPALDEATPTQDTNTTSDALKGAGFAGVVGAAVAAAVDAGDHENQGDKPKSLSPIDKDPLGEVENVDVDVNRGVVPDHDITEPTPALPEAEPVKEETEAGFVPPEVSVPVPTPVTTSDEKGAVDGTNTTGLGAIVDAAVAQATGSTSDQLASIDEGQQRGLDSNSKDEAEAGDVVNEDPKVDNLPSTSAADNKTLDENETAPSQPEEVISEPATSEASSKKSKKNKKKNKKNKSVDLASEEQTASTSAPADEEVAGVEPVSHDNEKTELGLEQPSAEPSADVPEQESAPMEARGVEDVGAPEQEGTLTPTAESGPEDKVMGLGIDMAPAAENVEPSSTAPEAVEGSRELEPEATPAPAPAPASEPEPTFAAPEAVETNRELEPEAVPADDAEPASMTTSSKKSKRDKKKKKSKGGVSEDQDDIPVPSNVGATEGEVSQPAEEPAKSEAETELQAQPAADESKETAEENVAPTAPVEAGEPAEIPQEQESAPEPIQPSEQDDRGEPEASKELSQPTEEPPMTTAPAEPTDAEASPETTEAAKELDLAHEQGVAETSADAKPEIEGLTDTAPPTELEPEPQAAIETAESAVPQEKSLDVAQDDGTVPEQHAPEAPLDSETKPLEPEAEAPVQGAEVHPDGQIPESVPVDVDTKPETDGAQEEEKPLEQERLGEAPEGESSMPSDPAPADPESEGTSLSRKNSKKNKKKNKRKSESATETPTEQDPAANEQPQTEEVPSTETEPVVAGDEQPQDAQAEPSQVEEVPSTEAEQLKASEEPPQDQKPEDIPQPIEQAEVPKQEDQPSEPTVETTVGRPDGTEETQEEPTKKKKKNKKNRKSSALSESQPEPESEPKPEQQESVDTAETRQTGGEISTGDDNQAAPPETTATSGEPAGVQDVEPAPAVTNNETDPPVEKSEANDGSPHVSAPPNVESESAPEPEPASTPLNEQQGDENKDGISTIPDESGPDQSSNTDVKDTDANVDVAPSSEEPLPAPEPSKEEQQPIANEMSRDLEIDVPETQSQDAVEEDVPMTSAQKKKAKKEKNKKKRQSVSVDETPASEPADDSTAQQQEEGRDLPVSDAAPVDESPAAQEPEKDNSTANEEPAVATATAADAGPMQEEPRSDASATANVEAEAVSDEPAAPEPIHEEKAVDPEASPIATAEAAPVETEPTQEKAGAGADVGTAATTDEPSAETKPAEEPQDDATIGVEPAATTDPTQETTKDDANVGTDVNTTTEDPSATDTGLEKTQTEDNAVDVAPTHDQAQDVTTEPTQEQQTVPEPDNASTAKSPEEIQEPEPASSSKSKKNKKKKKNRQSAAGDDEPSTPAESEPTTPVTESPSEAATVPEESPAVSHEAEKQTEAPTEAPTEVPTETPAEAPTEDSTEAPTQVPTEGPVAEETTGVETPVTEAEPTEEAETPTSKKKAKKDKKKRKSVTFDTEKPPGQPNEPVESESVQPAESTEPVQPVAPETAAEVVEQKPESSDVSADQSPTAPDSASTDELQVEDTPLDTPVEPIAAEAEDKPTPTPEELEKEAPIDEATKDEAAAPQEAEPAEVKEDTKSDLEPLSTISQPDATPETAEADQPPAVESEPQTPVTEAEQEPGSAKSKKNKKKKKKGKASEVDENAPSEPGNDVPVESEKALDAGTGESKEESKDPGVATPESKEPEPESIETAPEAPEVKEAQEPAPQPETPEQDAGSTSKSKKKAKKDRKRQSKTLDSNDAAAADEKPMGPSLETATEPAEDYGKEHQSRDTENDAASNDKDLFWTDQIVSSQVEQQQQATNPTDYPSKLDSEKVEDDSVPVPVTEPGECEAQPQADVQPQAESGEPLETNDASTAVNEPEASGEVGTNADNELPAEVSEEKRDGNEDDGAGMVPVQEEAASKGVPDEVVEQSVEAVNENEQTATEEPGTHGEAVVEDSKPEEPPAPNEEEFSPLTSGKKKKKDKKKNKKQQDDVHVEESQAVEPSMDNAEPEPSEHQTLPDAEQPIEAEGNPPLSAEEPTREISESAEEPAKPSLEAEAATEPVELSKNTTSQLEDFEEATPSKKKSKKDKKKNKKSQPEEQPVQESDVPLTPGDGDAPTSVPSGDQLDAPADVEPAEATSPPSVEKENESGQKDIDGSQTDLNRPSEDPQDIERGVEILPSGESTDDTTVGEPTPGPTPLIGSEETPGEMTGEVEDNDTTKGVEREELPSFQAETSERPPEMNEPTPTTEPAADVDAGEQVEKSTSEAVPPLETIPEQATEQAKEELPTANEEAAPVEIPEEQEPDPAAQESGEQQEAAAEPLSRKESKKKKKKAKKQSKDEEEPATPAPVEEVVPGVGSEDAKDSSAASPEEPAVKEQVDYAFPTREANVSTELPTVGEQSMTTEGQNEPNAKEKEEEETQDKLQGQIEHGTDLEATSENLADSAKEPETTAPLSRKLSKKEKRKAKKAAEESIEPATEELAPSQSPPTTGKGNEERNGEQEQEENEKVGGKGDLNKQQVTNNPPLKQTPKSQAQETTSQRMKTHHQLAQDNDLWPEIDWTYNSADSKQQNSLPSPETRPIQAAPLEPAIGEFDEAAVPEAVAPIPENDKIEPPVETTSQPQPRSSPEPRQETEAPTVNEKPEGETDVPSRPLSRVDSIFPHLERKGFRRPASKESLKDRAEEETMDPEVSRENAIQVSEAPITLPKQVQEEGERELPAMSTAEDPSFERSMTTESETPVTPVDVAMDEGVSKHVPDNAMMPLHAPLPLNEQSCAPVDFSPVQEKPDRKASSSPSCELRRSPSVVHGRHEQTPRSWTLEEDPAIRAPRTPSPSQSLAGETSPPRTPLHTIAEQEPEDRVGTTTMDSSRGTPRLEMKPEHVLPRPETPTPGRKFTDNALARQAWPTQEKEEHGDDEIIKNPKSRSSSQTPVEPPKTPEQGMPILKPSSVKSANTSMQNLQNNSPSVSRSLRRTTNRRTPSARSASGDLRAASRALENPQPPAAQPPQPQPQPPSPPSDFNVERIASSSSYDPVTDKGKRPVRGMTDVYEAWGETPNSPRSPSRPPSVRHRRSIQHLQDVETRLDQLISENRLLVAARDAAEDKLRKTSVARRKSDNALNRSDADLRDREAELEQWQESVQWHQKEVARLTEENDGLTTMNANITAAHAQEIQAARESSAHQLEELRSQYQQVTADMQDRVRYEVEQALSQKNADLRRLREELESARDKVKRLQEEIAASVHDGVLTFRDEDFFDAACQKLCGHVQQWVLRFSKHSDHRRCRRLGDLHDEKIADRFDNAILDGSDADAYLGDRVRRRDVFMSVVMTMVWEFIFTRYLFGMERDQRQKLKSLEKQLGEVGPRSAVHRWRATTLSLLSKRPSFSKQRENDTEAVAREIFSTLTRLLPPPTQVENQLLESLRKVLRIAVSLSVEMRSQLAEYIMLPPLQPEYNTNGDLARLVYFNASLMNERSGQTTSNEELENQQLPVRIVLFPLVVKKGNDKGEGEEEVVVCPAQVLVARPAKDKQVSQMLSSDRMSLDASRSVHSAAPSSNMDVSNLI